MESVVAWVLENSAWLGFPGMGLFGGLVGHVLASQSSLVKWGAMQHIAGIVSSWIYGLFIGTCAYQFQQWAQLNLPMMFLGTGFLSVFGSQTIRLVYDLIINKLKTWMKGE